MALRYANLCNVLLFIGGSLFSDYQALMRIWTHPWALKLETARQIEKFIDSDDSMADFVVEDGEEEESAASSENMSWTSDSSEGEKGNQCFDRKRGGSVSTGDRSWSPTDFAQTKGHKKTRLLLYVIHQFDESVSQFSVFRAQFRVNLEDWVEFGGGK